MIKKSVNIKIGGEEREAKFTIGALEELEAMLPSHNVFSLMQNCLLYTSDAADEL